MAATPYGVASKLVQIGRLGGEAKCHGGVGRNRLLQTEDEVMPLILLARRLSAIRHWT